MDMLGCKPQWFSVSMKSCSTSKFHYIFVMPNGFWRDGEIKIPLNTGNVVPGTCLHDGDFVPLNFKGSINPFGGCRL